MPVWNGPLLRGCLTKKILLYIVKSQWVCYMFLLTDSIKSSLSNSSFKLKTYFLTISLQNTLHAAVDILNFVTNTIKRSFYTKDKAFCMYKISSAKLYRYTISINCSLFQWIKIHPFNESEYTVASDIYAYHKKKFYFQDSKHFHVAS